MMLRLTQFYQCCVESRMAEPDEHLSREDAASPLAKLALSYLTPLLELGSKRPLSLEDIGALSRQDAVANQFDNFQREWDADVPTTIKGWKLGRILLRAFGARRLLLAMVLYMLMAAAQFGPVLILNALVGFFEGTRDLSTATLWILIALLAVLPVFGSICSAQYTVIMSHFAIGIKNSLVVAIYRKSLKMSVGSRKNSSTGKIVNMFSGDTEQLERLMGSAGMIVFAPWQIAVAIYLIYGQIGVAVFVGLGLMVLFAPISGVVFGTIAVLRKKSSAVTDSRVKLMNEILGGIRLVKYFAWEEAFKERINAIRLTELEMLRKIAIVVALGFSMILLSLPLVQPILVFYTYIRLGNSLDSATAFTTLALFSIIRFPFAFLPMGLTQLAQSKIAAERILTFLLSRNEVASNELLEGAVSAGRLRMLMCENISEKDREAVSCTAAAASEGENTLSPVSDIVIQLSNTIGSWNEPDEDPADTPSVPVTGETGKKHDYTLALSGTGTEGEIVAEACVPWQLGALNVTIRKGELVAVIGPVGCGKSSFLSAVLGEMPLTSGGIFTRGSISYCDQRPWIMNATLKDNILFGLPFDEKKFDTAISSTCLDEDVNLLPGGILTEIGERGINLSGGQKARVALARALYRSSDICLMDDPLSAVDAFVGSNSYLNSIVRDPVEAALDVILGSELFNECILTAMKNSTRVLVTHQVHLLAKADRILVFKQGQLVADGSFSALTERGINLMEYVSKPESENKENETESPRDDRAVSIHVKENGNMTRRREASTMRKTNPESVEPTSLLSKEERAAGAVPLSTYNYYFASGGILVFGSLILTTLCAKGMDITSQFYLAFWNSKSKQADEKDESLSSSDNMQYLNIYALILMLGVASFVVRSIASAVHRLTASYKLHGDILGGVLKAPISFFDVTPIGRILNRFSSDMMTIDHEMGPTVIQYMNCVITAVGSMTAIAVSTKGTFLILLVPLMVLYYSWKNFFIKSNTELKRLININRSPIYSDFSTVLGGIVTIRAFGDQSRFIKELEIRINNLTAPAVMSYFAVQWLSVRLDFVGALISFFIAVLTAATWKYNFIPAGYLALALSISFDMTIYLRQAVNMAAQLEAQMNSVQRIRHYTLSVLPETDVHLNDSKSDENSIETNQIELRSGDYTDRKVSSAVDYKAVPAELKVRIGAQGAIIPPDNWPDQGEIKIYNLHMKYREGPEILKGVSFDVKGGSKVGIAGRSGSGKSSLMVALFRIEQYTPHSAITIDGIDISKVPLSILRSRLNIIPQDPVLFAASLRFNLDPFSHYTDEQIWDVLDAVLLKDFVMNLANRLDEMVAEGGDNFSSGQRQILCIARVLLKNPKVIVLDEATSSIDNNTDVGIQAMIRKRFAGSTVLTIAHRLHTIMDCDKILVLDNGCVAEMGSPQDLLKKENGIFRVLWNRQRENNSYGIIDE